MRILFFLFFVCSASGMAPFTSTHVETLKQQRKALEAQLQQEQDPEKQQGIAQWIGAISHLLKEQEAKQAKTHPPSLISFPELPTEDEREPLIAPSTPVPYYHNPVPIPSIGMVQPSIRLTSRGPGMPHKKRSLDSCCLSWLLCCQK